MFKTGTLKRYVYMPSNHCKNIVDAYLTPQEHLTNFLLGSFHHLSKRG